MTLLDSVMAKLCGLTVTPAVNGSLGCYVTPGGQTKDYVGIVKGPIDLRVGKGVTVRLPFLRVIDHEVPLFLLGADVLRAGNSLGQTAFMGIYNESDA